MADLTKQQKFVQQYYDDAIKTQIQHGVPYQVTLGQAALESAWGKTAPQNNFFGIKAGKNYSGQKQLLWTHEYIKGERKKIQDWFRSYPEAYDSFADHAEVLKKRFPVAFQYKNNPDEFIRSIQRDHGYKYATDPIYSEKIISIMRMIKAIVQQLKLDNKPTKEVIA